MNKLIQWIKGKEKNIVEPAIQPCQSILSTELPDFDYFSEQEIIEQAFAKTFQKDPIVYKPKKSGQTMDSCFNGANLGFNNGSGVSAAQIAWYGSQGFIGYQLCALISQNWLVRKCCSMPAQDATRNGYEVTSNNGENIPPKIIDAIRQADKKYRITKNMLEFITKGKIFGIRVCIYQVKSSDPDYYLKPFNIDSVKPGTYLGMSQVDPFWITPELGTGDDSDPTSQNFYEPTWWRVNNKKYHRSHLAIYREDGGQMADTLKPTYLYGGISIPQKIYERVYAAERTANEAPLLALTKRTRVYQTDLSQAISQGQSFVQKIQKWVNFTNNYGIQAIGLGEEVKQFDLALADFDALIMTQYQLVCSGAGVLNVKIMETSPEGFNTTGEFEEASYHEKLEGLQEHDLTPLLNGHHQRLIRSEIAPQFGIAPFETTIVWKPLDAMTAKEEAEVNNIKADTDSKLSQSGAIDGNDIRDRIISDPNSGYSGITNGAPEQEELEESENDSNSEET